MPLKIKSKLHDKCLASSVFLFCLMGNDSLVSALNRGRGVGDLRKEGHYVGCAGSSLPDHFLLSPEKTQNHAEFYIIEWILCSACHATKRVFRVPDVPILDFWAECASPLAYLLIFCRSFYEARAVWPPLTSSAPAVSEVTKITNNPFAFKF